MYKKVDKNVSYVDKEREVLKFWKDNQIFEKSIELRKDAEPFTFYDGPPTANGMPHIGHVLTRAVKDIIPRYRTMKGYNVLRKAGWDTHGLPVELEIEKMLGISGKPQIEDYGIEPFIKQCKESVWKYKGEWEVMSDQVGFWVDMEDPYITYDNNYIESVWWALKSIWDKGLIYKGHKIVPYCPRCGTSLSSHEVAQGYKNVKDKTAIAKFKVVGEDAYFLAWTTTPWTLPSNVALVVNPDEDYAKVTTEEGSFYLADNLVSKYFEEDAIKNKEICKGSDLEHKEYEPLFGFMKPEKKAYFVTMDNYVTLTDGTGIVHCAPAFGEDDARIGRKYDLPFLQPVDEQGKFTSEVTPWATRFVKDCDLDIIIDLKTNGKLFKSENHEHSYPFCWRCDTPLLYYARSTWFIEMTKVRDKLVENNKTINWYPETIGTGRFGNFLENVIDWGLSRERYWGTPLPIWECGCGHRHMIGSIEELKSMSNDCPDDIELHKPYVDNVHIKCDKCGDQMTRVSEVIDCWFDSGSMPFAQFHYPFENKEKFDATFPANFISEAVDQTRGWFYSLSAISTLLFDKAPFQNVIVLGHVQDANGQKMSKSKGNAVSPSEALAKQGADAVRWYFYYNSQPWLPSRYSDENVNEGQSKFLAKLWNTYSFFVLYANIDNFDASKYQLDINSLNESDRWILSKLNTLVKFVDEGLTNYKLTETSRAMMTFVDELSNWYVRINRERFWGEELNQDKINAYMTLYTSLVTMAKISAPYTPFMAEAIYTNLVCSIDSTQPESVHLCDFPQSDAKFINLELEQSMSQVDEIVTLGRAGRENAGIKNRQPIGNMFVKTETKLADSFIEIIKNELNIKNVAFKDDTSEFSTYSYKPQLKTLGKKYGKIVPMIGKALTEVEPMEFMEKLKTTGATLTVEDETVELSLEDVLVTVEKVEGYITESNNTTTVVLETKLTEELVTEGYMREVVSKIQNMRKENGYEVMDKITVNIFGSDAVEKAVKEFEDRIKADVLATDILYTNCDYAVEKNINGQNVSIGVRK